MAETQKSKQGTQGGTSKQHAAAGSKSHQGSSRDSNARSQQGSSRSQSDSKSGNDKNR
jgi:hypothetical protein